MMTIRRASERGHADHGWLNTYHTFSFADYYDPQHMGFGPLRVINEDRVAPGAGFPMHSHRDMEIISYVLDGALEHKDSLGNGSIIHPGECQRMSAGTGVRHSEHNASLSMPVHFLQIWIEPAEKNLPPGYEQKPTNLAPGQGLQLLASPAGRNGLVTIHQDAYLYAGVFTQEEARTYHARAGRGLYLHVARGRVSINSELLSAGDGAQITEEHEITISACTDAEVLLFDLIMRS